VAESLAFWFDKEKEHTLPEVELHVNFWSLGSDEISYLDIGVRLHSTEKSLFNNLNIFIPFKVNSDNYFPQLGALVCNDRELISAIFNTNVSITTVNSKNDVFNIEFSSQNKINFFTQILPSTDSRNDGVNISNFQEYGSKSSGTTLSFPKTLLTVNDKDGDCYFRFRIKLDKNSKKLLGPESSPTDSWVTSHFETREMVDFRVNEPRNLPSTIRSKLNETFTFKMVHFFLIRESNSEFKLSHSDYKRCRILENDIWQNYLTLGNKKNSLDLPEQMLIYHWTEQSKQNKKLEHFSAFAKFTKRDVTNKQLRNVIIFVFLIGMASGLGANTVWKYGGKLIDASIEKIKTYRDTTSD
jgi:hypothetical protein